MVTCYPCRGKAKSVNICVAFAEAASGQLVVDNTKLEAGPVFFWGVDASNVNLWLQAKARGDYYYGDNSYFDGTSRGEYFRITRNRLQHSGEGQTDGTRFIALDIPITVKRGSGSHIVVCPQSDYFMTNVIGYRGDWLKQTVAELRDLTDREIRVREWNRDKAKAQATLAADLAGAHALVTWSSAAAVTAALAGVPPFVGGDCPARFVGNDDISYIENPHLGSAISRLQWAGVLADNQWTLEEIRTGVAWAALNG